jgi:hypothetical protein
MTFFELREAALNFAPLSVAAAVVAEAEERQGEEEEDKRFADRQTHFTYRIFCIGIEIKRR